MTFSKLIFRSYFPEVPAFVVNNSGQVAIPVQIRNGKIRKAMKISWRRAKRAGALRPATKSEIEAVIFG